MIKYYDFNRRYPNGRAEILHLVKQQASSGAFILKGGVSNFESALCDKIRARNVVCVSSGTSAMTLSLVAAGIKPGDEVITPAFCYVAAASAIVQAGALPVFADVRPDCFTLDPHSVYRMITPRTRAVLIAHVFAGIADIGALRSVLPPGVLVLEDSATAFGARTNDRYVGTLGDVGVYSFFPAKPLGGLGDGGAVITENDEIARRVRMLRNHGQDDSRRFYHQLLGFNSRMDDLNAAWLMRRLGENEQHLARKQEISRRYDAAIAQCQGLLTVQHRHTPDFSPHAYVVRAKSRARFAHHMNRAGIETKIHFGTLLPDQPAFKNWSGGREDYTHSRAVAEECIAIPLCPGMDEHQIARVVESVLEYGNAPGF